MGFSSWIKKAFKTGAQHVYDGVSKGVKTGFNRVNSLFKGAGRAAHWIDDLLSHKTGFDLVDDVLSLVKDNSIYSSVLSGIDGVNTTLDDIGRLGGDVDELLRRGLFGQHAANINSPAAAAVRFNAGFQGPAQPPTAPVNALSAVA